MRETRQLMYQHFKMSEKNYIHPDSTHQRIQGCSNKSLLYTLAIVTASCVSISIIVHHHGSYDTKQIKVINEQNSVISDLDLKYSDVDRRLNDASITTDGGNLVQCSPVGNEWCMVQMPSISYFGFDPPTDHQRWEHSKIAAMNGDPVLLSRIVKHFTSHLDFLNGDTYFRRYHELADFFFDRNSGLSPLLNNDLSEPPLQPAPYPWERSGYSVLPRNYNQFRKYKRAAIIKLGYHAFQKVHDVAFVGAPIGKALMHRREFFEYWNTVKDRIVHPFILLDVHDENWGLLSTYFPNRTSNWGICCNQSYDSLIMDFLNHEKTIMMVINQHSNYSHPKIVSSPRGLPIHEHRSRIIWDVMRGVLQMNTRKSKFVYSALTNSVSRPQILACIRNKFIGKDASELIVDLRNDKEEQLIMNKMGKIAFRRSYYNQIASTRVGLALPGIGYDTWRLWEMLTLGTVPVLERAVGLDKTVWRLPALLVDDFADVTPALLRSAYVEALYRADDFEFERLTQTYWWNFIMNVSSSRSSETIQHSFPYSAEKPNFMRPLERFDCSDNQCGADVKSIPQQTC